MKTLILTVGLPRAGKSTWARKQGIPIVNPDSIRLALHGEAFIPNAEKMVWTQAHYMVQSLFIAGHDKVILDATNITKKMRKEWENKNWNCVYQVFPAGKEMCIGRAIADKRDDLKTVIERMAKEITYPKENLYE